MSKIHITNLEISDWFKQQPEKIDIWCSDVPYPFDNQNGSGRMKFEDGTDNLYNRLTYADLEACYAEMLKLSNQGASCYIFTDRDGLFSTKPAMERVGWTYRNIIVWNKVVQGMGCHFRNQVEYIVYCTNGKTDRYVTKIPNIISAKKPKGVSAKPPVIWQTILQHQLREGDVTADCFAGSDPLSQALNGDAVLMSKLGRSYSNIYQGAGTVVPEII